MSENSKRYGLPTKLGFAAFPVILAWILNATDVVPVWSWVTGIVRAIPSTAIWGSLWLLSVVAELGVGARIANHRSRREWTTAAEAADLVRGSNYWSKLERRDRMHRLFAEVESAFGGQLEPPDDLTLEVEAIKPQRHTLNVEATLQNFWDDNPTARYKNLYHHNTLLNWLQQQASIVEIRDPFAFDPNETCMH